MIVAFLLRFISYPFSFLPYPVLHALGRIFGIVAYHLNRRYRLRTLNNLKIAGFSNRETIAKASFQSLFITIFELARLIHKPHEFTKRATCENPEIFEGQKGVVLLSSHQANWEIGLFDLIPGSKGVTIGRPHKNKYLYSWILSMRERNGNRIIPKENALKEGIAALKRGEFFAFFGDQAYPKSDYAPKFFGMRAFTTTTPALVAYRTGKPLCVVTKKRVGNAYVHRYSPLIFPDKSKSFKEEVPRMMDKALFYVEESIRKKPEEWLWQHNRWKQGNDLVCKKYRYDFILVIMSDQNFEKVKEMLKSFYPKAFFTWEKPGFSGDPGLAQLVFDFVGDFKSNEVMEVLTFKGRKTDDLLTLLPKVLHG